MKKYHIGPQPAQIDPALLKKFENIEVATIGHFRHRGFVSRSIAPVFAPGRTVVGTAVTIAIPTLDSTMLHHAIGFIRPGDFFIIDRLGDTRHACVGGGISFAIRQAGAVGVVLDGPCVDVKELEEVGLPIWASGVSAVTTRKLDLGGSMNLPVACGNVPVIPGDLVVADETGVVIIPVDEAEEVAEEALARQGRSTRERVAAGEKMGDISGASNLIMASVHIK